MSTADFLLELRSEEIPARMQASARADLEKLFRKELDVAGLKAGAITVWSTPRRLALIARDLPLATEAVSEEVKGPRTSAPAQALEGFLRKTGLTADQLTERDGVWFAVNERPGRATAEVLAATIPAIIRAFPWPKSQRWGAASLSPESLRWVRPLSGIVALLGGEVVPCEIGGIASGRVTRGHRFHSAGDISIDGVEDYAAKLLDAKVIVDHAAREGIVRDSARAAAAAAGLVLVDDEGLVVENAGLTEWPVPLLGRFDEAFLEVPPEVIQLTARVNQKYFICRDAAGKLANAFVCTANVVAKDGGAAIVDGNRKVLAARLSDARFFWEQDKKKPLSVHAEKLGRITFHEKLGTVADKVERVAKLARWLVEEGIIPPRNGEGDHAQHGGGGLPETQLPPANPLHRPAGGPPPRAGEELSLAAQAELAARLCKADLVTEMVGEFPELQGLMGGYYARAEGLPDAVADAIRDHYKPVGQGDDVPTAPVTVAVALADKLDTLVGFFAIQQKPTGSKDPFALRRAALAVEALIIENDIRTSLSRLVTEIYGFFLSTRLLIDNADYLSAIHSNQIVELLTAGEWVPCYNAAWDFNLYVQGVQAIRLRKSYELNGQNTEKLFEFLALSAVVPELLNFFADRLKVQQKEAGVRHDLIDAVFALGGEDDLVRLLARVHALQAFVGTEDGKNLLAGYKRAANILKKEEFAAAAADYAREPAEAALAEALAHAAPQAEAAVAAEDFTAAMAALAGLRAPIDSFFEQVTVNDADANKRAYRLGLLADFRAAVHKVADFSRIDG